MQPRVHTSLYVIKHLHWDIDIVALERLAPVCCLVGISVSSATEDNFDGPTVGLFAHSSRFAFKARNW